MEISELFGHVLEKALPGAKWAYRNRTYGNRDAARELFPVFLKRVMVKLRPLSLLPVFGLENVKIAPDLSASCGLSHNLAFDLPKTPLLCLLLDQALVLSLNEKNGIILLDSGC